MEVRIHVPRPLLTLTIIAVALLIWNGVISFNLGKQKPQADASGGVLASAVIAEATQDIDRERVKQAVLDHREEILRFQVQVLEQEVLREKNPEKLKALTDSRAVLLSIIRQRRDSEKLLKLSLEQLWEAEGTVYADRGPAPGIALLWPVEPALGLSATFDDQAYLKRFGFPHRAVDIPVDQGTPLRAARDGTVLKVSMNGLGYSSVVLSHEGNVETIYGHISSALVQPGDVVRAGQSIALSGGQPGTPGAGLLTTGPHVHFAVRVKGALVDPLPYLPRF